MWHFCTYFDRFYLPRGIALHESLLQHCPDFTLYALCLDPLSESILRKLNLPKLEIISAADFFASDSDLAALAHERETLDFYFTCTPVLPIYLFAKKALPHMIYLDADLYFFANPDPVLSAVQDSSAAIIPHRYPASRDRTADHGIYNVGMIYFDRSDESAAILSRWRAQCIACCFNSTEQGQFGDQKYLDEWPSRYPRLAVIDHAGCNIAPWNFVRHQFEFDQQRVTSDGMPVIFAHFHHFHRVWWRFYNPLFKNFDVRPNVALLWLYRHYTRAVERAEARCKQFGDISIHHSKTQRHRADAQADVSWRSMLRKKLQASKNFLRDLLQGRLHWL